MPTQISITAVVENTCFRHLMLASHGQSLLIDYLGHRYLFDLGEIPTGCLYNLSKLGLTLKDIEALIFSHKHDDHVGALNALMPQLMGQPVYVTPNFIIADPAMARHDPLSFANVNQLQSYAQTVVLDQPKQLQDRLYLTGPVGEMQEQAVVIVGCSHPTVPQMVDAAIKATGKSKIYGLIGGMHLKGATEAEIDAVIQYLQATDIAFVVPSHCTSARAGLRMKTALGDRVKVSASGTFGVGNTVTLLPELKFDFV